MQNALGYTSEIKTVPFGNGKTLTIENLTPILTPKERERRKKEIEKRLYDVFSKYTKPTKSQI
jgi:oligoendopeptidase F